MSSFHLISSQVQLVAGEVTGFEKSKVALADGQLLDADVVVLATGYRPLNDSVERPGRGSLARVWIYRKKILEVIYIYIYLQLSIYI